MTASPQDAPSADSLPSWSDAGAQESLSGPSGPMEAAERPVAKHEEPDDLGDGFTPYISTIAEALAATPNGRAAAEYAIARYGPGATFKHGYTSGGRELERRAEG